MNTNALSAAYNAGTDSLLLLSAARARAMSMRKGRWRREIRALERELPGSSIGYPTSPTA